MNFPPQAPAQAPRPAEAPVVQGLPPEAAANIERAMAQAREAMERAGLAMSQEGATPTAVYEAARNRREELENQLDRLRDEREEITDQLESGNLNAANQQGLEERLSRIDARIQSVDQEIALAEAAVARAAGVPGAVQPPPPPPPDNSLPDEFIALGAMLIVFVAFPLVLAYARRLWKRSSQAVSALPRDFMERFARLEHGMDTIAIEVERIGEGQRYMTRALTERGAEANARDSRGAL